MSRKLIPHAKAAERYGRHSNTLDRWAANPTLGFPQPIRILGKKYHDEELLDAFDERQREAPTAPDMLKGYRDLRGEAAQ